MSRRILSFTLGRSLRDSISAKRFLKATVFGTAAGAAGAFLYYAVLWLTGYQFGLVAIIVGLLVGGGVRAGCGGRGGWLYQALAIFLTYCAIVVTFVPGIIQAVRNRRASRPSTPR